MTLLLQIYFDFLFWLKREKTSLLWHGFPHWFKSAIVCLLFLPILAYGEVQVRSFVQPKGISPQDTLTLTVEVEYESPVHINDPRLPDLKAFHLIDQSQSHQIHIINGNRTNKKQYQYVLQPKTEGKFKLGIIEVVVEGQVYKTTPQEEITISSKIKPRPKSKSRSFSFGFGKRGLMPFFSDPFFEEKNVNKKDLFLKLKVNKTKAYVGEMILAEWFFYFPLRGSHFNSEVTKSPTLNGFWVESVFQLGAGSSFRLERTKIKDQTYGRQKLIAHALFPIQTGNLTIGSLQAKNWPTNFSSLFSGSNKPIIKKSRTQTVNVVSLPKEGRGPLWTSAVGDFVVSAELSKNVVSVTEPVVYKVQFKGVGHPKWIRLPNLDFGNNFTVYDRTESQFFSLSESQKTYEVILLPKKAGDWLIPSFELSTFDSGLGIYKTHVLPALKLTVTGEVGLDSNKTEKYFSDKKTKKSQNLDRALPKPLSSWVESKQNIFLQNRKTFWLLVYQFLVVFFILSLYKIGFFKTKKSSFLNQELKKGLKQADQAIRRKDWKKATLELQQVMYDFFWTLLEQEEGAIKNWSVLLQKLPPSVRIKHEESICDLIACLEKLSFAPDEETKDMQNKKTVLKLKKTLLHIINQISKEHLRVGGTKVVDGFYRRATIKEQTHKL